MESPFAGESTHMFVLPSPANAHTDVQQETGLWLNIDGV